MPNARAEGTPSHPVPHPEVPASAGLEGGFQPGARSLEASFEAPLRSAPQDEGEGGKSVGSPIPALRAEGLDKRFGGLWAVRGVSLDVAVGEIHAVIGPNGAGKSTLINLLSGDLRVTAGTIAMGDRDVTRFGSGERSRAGIGRSYQKTTIFPDATVLENARLAVQAHSRRPLAMWARAEGDAAARERALAALAQVGLQGQAGAVAGRMSHGEQRALEIAMVLAGDPRIVLLDEPLAGMGTAEARTMIALIATLREGRAVLLVEHDMDAVFALADRLTVMADGRVIASGWPEAVRADPAVRAAYLGEPVAA